MNPTLTRSCNLRIGFMTFLSRWICIVMLTLSTITVHTSTTNNHVFIHAQQIHVAPQSPPNQQQKQQLPPPSPPSTVDETTTTNLLPLGQINVMVLTDVHSWVAGHLPHEPNNDADYGDILSFYEHLKSICASQKKDLFFVMNGDFIDGTGLTTYPPIHLTPILQHMPWDAINIGNHELYKNSTMEYITRKNGFVDFWNGKYLTSNVVNSTTLEPIGHRYRYLHGTYSNKTILTFGFLYNFQRHCEATIVETVEEVLNSVWFLDVVLAKKEKYDSIMVLAHMGYNDALVDLILSRIRQIRGDDDTMPVQFITGHTHIRAYRQLDYYSTSFEAGRYLDTVGLVSFPYYEDTMNENDGNHTKNNNLAMSSSTDQSASLPSSSSPTPTVSSQPSVHISNQPSIVPNEDFMHKFIDTSVNQMKTYVGVDELRTPNGTKLSNLIQQTQNDLGLFEILGCSPETYFLKNPISKKDSLWGLYLNKVIPQQLFENVGGGDNNILIQGTGSFRYSLFVGNVSVTDLISVSPFNDAIHLVDDQIKGQYILDAFGLPNTVDPKSKWGVPTYAMAGASSVEPSAIYKIYSVDFDVGTVANMLKEASNRTDIVPEKIPSITTDKLWKGYISENWVCIKEVVEEEEPKPKNFFIDFVNFFEEFTAVKAIAFILTFIIIMFFGYMFVCRSPSKSMFTDDAESTSDLSMMDDMSIDEFSGSEGSQNSSVYMPKSSSPQSNRSKRLNSIPQYHSFEPSSGVII